MITSKESGIMNNHDSGKHILQYQHSAKTQHVGDSKVLDQQFINWIEIHINPFRLLF